MHSLENGRATSEPGYSQWLPVEVVRTGEILGFQCWEWVKRRGLPPIWAKDIDDLARNDEDAVAAKTLAMRYPFYGIYELPDDVEKMPIVEHS